MYIYVLKLADQCWYVGRTERIDVALRIDEHGAHAGSAWTRLHRPIRVDLVRPNAKATDEMALVVEYMRQYGIDRVRGGVLGQCVLSEGQRRVAQDLVRDLDDRCFRCGRRGHFVTTCNATTDADGMGLTRHEREPPLRQVEAPPVAVTRRDESPPTAAPCTSWLEFKHTKRPRSVSLDAEAAPLQPPTARPRLANDVADNAAPQPVDALLVCEWAQRHGHKEHSYPCVGSVLETLVGRGHVLRLCVAHTCERRGEGCRLVRRYPYGRTCTLCYKTVAGLEQIRVRRHARYWASKNISSHEE